MNAALAFLVGLFQAALSFFGFASASPELSPMTPDQVQQTTQEVMTQKIATDLTKEQLPIIRSFTGSTTLHVGEAGTWTIDASDAANPESPLVKDIRWGDESKSAALFDHIPLAADSNSFVGPAPAWHTYSVPGTYTISLGVRDRGGHIARTSASVSVEGDSSLSLFTHPTDGYNFTYNARTLEARTSSTTEFPAESGLRPSALVTSGGGYAQETEILTYRGTIDAAQDAFIGSYREYYNPQVIRTEDVTINGNQARIVTYKVTPSYPEAKVYIIAIAPTIPRTIVATGNDDVIASIRSN
ncbi:hypothetical protein HY970_01785 [Candidatus Kaiserbacteria bacterium]|nr:hypothetical protein [Candidatus Kaiserbacteria bacterium]